jgi:hypothetical protein
VDYPSSPLFSSDVYLRRSIACNCLVNAASEINRSNFKVRLVGDWASYFLLFVSGALFFCRGIAPSKLDHFKFWVRPHRINNQAWGRILGLSIFGEM